MTLPVREFRKSVTHISRSYGQEFSVLFFDSRCTYNSLPDISYESTGEPSLFNTWRESIAASELSHDACRRRQLSPLSCHFLLNEIKPYRNKRGRNKGTACSTAIYASHAMILFSLNGFTAQRYAIAVLAVARAFQFEQKSFDSILATEWIFSIRFDSPIW